MPKQKLTLFLANADSSLVQSFPTDPKGDIVIKYKNKNYKLRKNILKKASKFLSTAMVNCKDFHVKENFDVSNPSMMQELALNNILSILYGNKVSIDRFEIPLYYEIAKSFQIEELIKIILADIPKYISQYDIFVVLKIAQDHDSEQLFKMCIQQLEKQSFQQLKYHQMELFNLSVPLFKLIIHINNNSRSEKKIGISFRKINQLIWEYCQCNCLSVQKFQQLKLQVFDVSVLSSSEYKQIFLDYFNQKFQRQKFTFSSLTSVATQQSQAISKKYAKYFQQSADSKKQYINGYQQLEKSPNQFILQIQNIYLNKRIQQLDRQNKKLLEELKNLLTFSCKNRLINEKMECSMKGLQQQCLKKKLFSKQNILKMSQFSSTLQKMNEQIDAKIQSTERMYNKYSRIQQVVNVGQIEDKYNNITMQSVNFSQNLFLDGKQIQKRWNAQKLNLPIPRHKKMSWCGVENNQIKQSIYNGSCESLQIKRNRFMHRITFDELPVSIKCKSFSILSEMVTEDGFKKKCFKLIYRRYNHCPFRGLKNSIYNRKQLLVLIKTKTDQQIGGYLTTTLSQNGTGQFQDNKSFIFNLKKNIKCVIKPSQTKNALKTGKDRLLCFSTDLQISQYCLQNSSYCSWPNSYGNDECAQKGDGATWFAGGSQFQIQALQIYQVNQQEMEMVV